MNEPSRAITIVLADDHPIVLQGVIGLLSAEADMNVVAVCNDGVSAIQTIRDLQPDIAVIDRMMPGLDGLGVLAAAMTEGLKTRIVLLAGSASDGQILEAVTNGVAGMLLKDTAPDTLIQCIREVASGKRWLPPDLINAALDREAVRRSENAQLLGTLTPRECEVMLLVTEGLSNKGIGRRLGLSDGTVKIHLHNIYQKVGVANRTALAALTLAHHDELKARSQDASRAISNLS